MTISRILPFLFLSVLLFACADDPAAPGAPVDDVPRDEFRLENAVSDTNVFAGQQLRVRWTVSDDLAADTVLAAFLKTADGVWMKEEAFPAARGYVDMHPDNHDLGSWQLRLRLKRAGHTRYSGIITVLRDSSGTYGGGPHLQLLSPHPGDLLSCRSHATLQWTTDSVTDGMVLEFTLIPVKKGAPVEDLGASLARDGSDRVYIPSLPAGSYVLRVTERTTGYWREFGEFFLYDVRLSGPWDGVLHRGAVTSLRATFDWPDALHWPVEPQLHYSFDGGATWEFWRDDMEADFIDLPAIGSCHLRLSAPGVAVADTAGPFEVRGILDQYLLLDPGTRMSVLKEDYYWSSGQRVTTFRWERHYVFTGKTDMRDHWLLEAKTWVEGESDTTLTSFRLMKDDFMLLRGSEEPFERGPFYTRFNPAMGESFSYRVSQPRRLHYAWEWRKRDITVTAPDDVSGSVWFVTFD
jgi:hypothetical protein